MPRFRHILLLAVALTAIALPSVANAAGGWRQAIRDCAYDGRLHQRYSQSDLLQALHHLPPDITEYTDCQDVLRRGLAGLGGGSGSAVPGSVTPTASDLTALNGISHGSTPKISIGGRPISPGAGGVFNLASQTAANNLPSPLLWTLIALGATGALAGLVALRNRLPGMRRAALRILRR